MTRRDKIGLWVLITLFVVLIGFLAILMRREAKPARDFSESPIVKQRIINLRK